MVMPATMPGQASGTSTLATICHGEAPIAWAASIRPGSTSRSELSARRATKGTAATVSGTIAAVVPIEVPTRRRVSGMMAIIRMMKGVERKALTAMPNTRFTGALGQICPRPVITRMMPMGTPPMVASTPATPTIRRVSQRPSSNSPVIIGDMAENLRFQILRIDMGDGGVDRLLPALGLDDDDAEGQSLDIVDIGLENVQHHIELAHQLGDHRLVGVLAREGDAQDRVRGPVLVVADLLGQPVGQVAVDQVVHHQTRHRRFRRGEDEIGRASCRER